MQHDTRGLELLMVDSLGLRFLPIPQLAGACCKYMIARLGYQPEVKGEKQTLGHLGHLQIHRDFPQIKALAAASTGWAGRSSGHAL